MRLLGLQLRKKRSWPATLKSGMDLSEFAQQRYLVLRPQMSAMALNQAQSLARQLLLWAAYCPLRSPGNCAVSSSLVLKQPGPNASLSASPTFCSPRIRYATYLTPRYGAEFSSAMAIEAQTSSVPGGPVDQVPDEILGSIFLLNTVLEVDVGGLQKHDPFSTTLASAAVCRRWRQVALDYSLLWSRIIDYERHPLPWIKELLSRSKDSPLDAGEATSSIYSALQLRGSVSDSMRADEIMDLLLGHISRLRTLSVHVRPKLLRTIGDRLLPNPAPLLQSLTLCVRSPVPVRGYLGQLFENEAPLLRSLRLQAIFVDFHSPSLRNLRELCVYNILRPISITNVPPVTNPLATAPTVDGWLRILNDMPLLERLTLFAAIFPNRDDSPSNHVSLAHLRLLTIRSTVKDTATFLSNVSIPPSCGIRLQAKQSDDTTGPECSRLLALLSQQLPAWADKPSSRYLQAKLISGSTIHFGNSPRIGMPWLMPESEVLDDHAANSQDPILWLMFKMSNTAETIPFFQSLLRTYENTFRATTELDLWFEELDGSPATPAEIFLSSLDMFMMFTHVRTLNLLEDSPLYLLPLFQSSSPDGFPIFPALKTLTLSGTNCEDERREVYHTLVAFGLWRVEVRYPLTRLHLLQPRPLTPAMEALGRKCDIVVSVGSFGSRLEVEDEP